VSTLGRPCSHNSEALIDGKERHLPLCLWLGGVRCSSMNSNEGAQDKPSSIHHSGEAERVTRTSEAISTRWVLGAILPETGCDSAVP
jgi:hypothetical protein